MRTRGLRAWRAVLKGPLAGLLLIPLLTAAVPADGPVRTPRDPAVAEAGETLANPAATETEKLAAARAAVEAAQAAGTLEMRRAPAPSRPAMDAPARATKKMERVGRVSDLVPDPVTGTGSTRTTSGAGRREKR